jgi:DNA-binding NarL/FixJ family response regulator
VASQNSNSVILADRNSATGDGIRGLLEVVFDSIYVVADEKSLLMGAGRLAPRLIVLDQSLGVEKLPGLTYELRKLSANSQILVLALSDHPMIARAILKAGANAVVLKRSAGTDLFEALDAIERKEVYASPGLAPTSVESGTQVS